MLLEMMHVKDDVFKTYVEHVRDAYLPVTLLNSGKNIKNFKSDIESTLFYKTAPQDMKMPFLNNYHTFFIDFDNPKYNQRKKPKLIPNRDGHFNHFSNVVAATARLVEFFSDRNKILTLLNIDNADFENSFPLSKQKKGTHSIHLNLSQNEKLKLAEILQYDSDYKLRIFRLMLSAFYHDIGKTINEGHRHGMEGAITLSDHNSQSWMQLVDITKEIVGEEYDFYRGDLYFISDMVRHHDIFGTLSTGETGYLSLCEVIDRICQHSFAVEKDENAKSACFRSLFDLWILNLADIMSSCIYIEGDKKYGKFDEQDYWYESSRAVKRIDEFLNDKRRNKRFATKANRCQSALLIHDLQVSLGLLFEAGEQRHSDDQHHLMEVARGIAKQHSIERIRRLVCGTIKANEVNFLKLKSDNTNLCSLAEGLVDSIKEHDVREAIHKSMNNVSSFSDYIERMSWIGNMDYSLGFFNKIIDFAMDLVNKEIITKGKDGTRTGWIREFNKENEITDETVLTTVNQYFFMLNYAAIVVQLMGHLLYRDETPNKIRCFEFMFANKNLDNNKLKKLIALEGPFRTGQSIHMILESIFTY